ncbi:MAG: hypothetical protein KGJ47_08455 [Acidobacteriota bacterium]|nr:hypothetical protein [Acidobacteriota bacterium]
MSLRGDPDERHWSHATATPPAPRRHCPCNVTAVATPRGTRDARCTLVVVAATSGAVHHEVSR